MNELIIEYYQRPFVLIHEHMYQLDDPVYKLHPIRKRFWSLIQPGTYEPEKANELASLYLRAVEAEMANIISRQSVAYWLHLYRRLSPGPIGRNTDAATIFLTRATLEAVIQKYAKTQLCDRIAFSHTVPIEKVLGGVLMAPEFTYEREMLRQTSMLVLTDFTGIELREFYNLETLAYESWYCTALLRITAKGSPVVVTESEEFEYVFDMRSDELDTLVVNYDRREGEGVPWLLSSLGTVINTFNDNIDPRNFVFIARYNIGGEFSKELDEFLNGVLGVRGLTRSNFVWVPFNIKQFREKHIVFSSAFERHYGVKLDAVLLVVVALCEFAFHAWEESRSMVGYHWQRGYSFIGKQYIPELLFSYLDTASDKLGIRKEDVSKNSLVDAIHFWSVESSRSIINTAYPGPHSIFIPCEDHIFVDYVWIRIRLYNLFSGMKLKQQEFKGALLEDMMGKGIEMPENKKFIANDGRFEEIDGLFEVGGRLILIECKVIAKSIGFTRGDPKSITYRINMMDKALNQADRKSRFISENPIGRNYNLSKYTEVLSVVITPFVEYIWSIRSHYWINEDLPRVMTPGEFRTALEDETFLKTKNNVIPIA